MPTNSLLVSIPLQFPAPPSSEADHNRKLVFDRSAPRREEPLFTTSFIPAARGRRPLMAVLACFFEAILVTVLIIVPLFFESTLPTRGLLNALMLAPVPVAPPAPAPPIMAKRGPRNAPVMRKFNPDALVSPVVIPTEIAVIHDAPALEVDAAMGGVPGGIPGMTSASHPHSWATSVPVAPPPPPHIAAPVPPAPPPPPTAAPERINVGGDVQAALILEQVQPVYPLLARKARIQGSVKLQAVIGTNGRIKDLRVINGHPFLVNAALDAVRRWIYRPTVLNGSAVEVNTDIVVRFELS